MGNLTIAASKTYLITNITFQDRILRSENSARSKLELRLNKISLLELLMSEYIFCGMMK